MSTKAVAILVGGLFGLTVIVWTAWPSTVYLRTRGAEVSIDGAPRADASVFRSGSEYLIEVPEYRWHLVVYPEYGFVAKISKPRMWAVLGLRIPKRSATAIPLEKSDEPLDYSDTDDRISFLWEEKRIELELPAD